MATTLTPIDLVKDVFTAVAATALGAAGTAETFELIVTEPCHRVVIFLDNIATNKALVVSVSAGNYWFAVSAIAGSVAASSKEMLVFNGAGVKDKTTDKITIVLTPDAAADAAALIAAIQLPD